MSERLLPCPFCGADDSEDNATQQAAIYLVDFMSPIGKTASRVECQCGVSGPANLAALEAVSAWNRRAPITQEYSEFTRLMGDERKGE